MSWYFSMLLPATSHSDLLNHFRELGERWSLHCTIVDRSKESYDTIALDAVSVYLAFRHLRHESEILVWKRYGLLEYCCAWGACSGPRLHAAVTHVAPTKGQSIIFRLVLCATRHGTRKYTLSVFPCSSLVKLRASDEEKEEPDEHEIEFRRRMHMWCCFQSCAGCRQPPGLPADANRRRHTGPYDTGTANYAFGCRLNPNCYRQLSSDTWILSVLAAQLWHELTLLNGAALRALLLVATVKQ